MLTAGPLLPPGVLAWNSSAVQKSPSHVLSLSTCRRLYHPALLFTAQWPHSLHSGFGRFQHFSMTVLGYVHIVTGTGPVSHSQQLHSGYAIFISLFVPSQQPLGSQLRQHLSLGWRKMEEAAISWQLTLMSVHCRLLYKRRNLVPWRVVESEDNAGYEIETMVFPGSSNIAQTMQQKNKDIITHSYT